MRGNDMVHLCEQAFLHRHQALRLHLNIALDHNRVVSLVYDHAWRASDLFHNTRMERQHWVFRPSWLFLRKDTLIPTEQHGDVHGAKDLNACMSSAYS